MQKLHTKQNNCFQQPASNAGHVRDEDELPVKKARQGKGTEASEPCGVYPGGNRNNQSMSSNLLQPVRAARNASS